MRVERNGCVDPDDDSNDVDDGDDDDDDDDEYDDDDFDDNFDDKDSDDFNNATMRVDRIGFIYFWFFVSYHTTKMNGPAKLHLESL